MNLVDLFNIHFVGRKNKTALLYGERSLTFGELDSQSNRIARALQRTGLNPGDRIAFYLGNSIDLVLAYVASLKLRLIIVPMNTQYRDVEITHIVNDAGARAILSDTDRFQVLRPFVSKLHSVEHYVLAEELSSLASRESSEPLKILIDGEDIATLMYTSGTTGRSKGAMLTHNNLVANITGLVSAWHWTAEDTLLLTLPLFHMHGLGVALHGALTTGCTTILHSAFRSDSALDALLTGNVSLFMGVPTMYVRLIDEALQRGLTRLDLPRMRLFVSGSAPLSVGTFDQFERVFGQRILERYGMTETGMNMSNLYAGPRLPGTVGVPLPGVSARVVDEQGTPALDGQIGEIVLRGPNVFRGYWHAPEKTAEAFLCDADEALWFRTGDIGMRDPATGYFSLLSRRHDLIISGGFNIYPREIEELLAQHPAVAEAAVVAMSDSALGQVPVAFVVRSEPNVRDKDLIEYCRAHLARYKVPHAITFIDSLPRNAMGKIEKKRLTGMS